MAEVVLDGSVGSRGRLTLNGKDVRITPDMGTIRGANLFHSFATFGVPEGSAVTFEGPDGLNNVIGRVTGPDVSQIHGLLRSTVPFATLWLLAPNGLVVGKDARIDVPGSLHLSTADELRFDDGSKFSGRDLPGGTLTSAEPSAFGFLGGPVGDLTVEATELRPAVPAFANTSLTGGAVTLSGTTITNDGPLLVAAQRSAGEIPVYRAIATSRDSKVTIKGGSFLTAFLLGSTEALRIEGGEIAISASNLTAYSLDDGGFAGGPAIAIAGRSVQVDGGGDLGLGQILTLADDADRAPSIVIQADDLDLSRAAAYSPGTTTGLSGEVILKGARITVTGGTIVGSPSSDIGPNGKGGRTFIVASDRLVLDGGGQILNFTQGPADAGDVVLRVKNLQVADGDIATSSQGGNDSGRAGRIDIAASGNVAINGDSILGAFTITDAASGRIDITAADLAIGGRSRLTTSTESAGDAGDIALSASTVRIDGEALIDSTSTGSGSAGNIEIATPGELRLDGGTVSTTANPGSGGSIVLLVGQRLILENGGAVATRIDGAVAGERAGLVEIRGRDGKSAGPVVLDDTAFIIADAPNVGDGGTIRIDTTGLIAQPGDIDASARQGNRGTVATSAPQTNIVSSFAGLEAEIAPPDRLLAASCDARDIASSLIVGAVRGGEHAFDPDRPFGSPEGKSGCRR